MLPINTLPTYGAMLPISKQKIKFRPFTVKEQKILLQAVENDEEEFSSDNIKQIINNCLITKIDIDKLSIIDLEFIFIQIRARSVGEVVNLKYRCENTLNDGNPCKNSINIDLNLLDINIDNVSYNDTIELLPNMGIKMKFPDISMPKYINSELSESENLFNIIIFCIEYIYDADKIYYATEIKSEELKEFIESLTISQFEKVKIFFESLPRLKKDINVKCSKCGYEHNFIIEGLRNFFG